jgi:hypothetical protein
MDFGAILDKYGLPVATAAFFIFQYIKQAADHKKDLKEIAVKAVQSIDASTEALKDNLEAAKTAKDVSERNVTVLNRVEGLLLGRGQKNDGQIGD